MTDDTLSEVAPRIWQVRLPIRDRDPVNAYLLRDADGGITIIDAGTAFQAAQRWRTALGQLGAAPDDVRRIIITHHHPDHIGGSGALHKLTRAPVFASRSTIQQAPIVWGDRGRMERYLDELDDQLRTHGVPADIIEQQAAERPAIRALLTLPPDDAWHELVDGDRIEVAGRTWRIRLTPGHADGHLVLHDEQGSVLLAGDHLLERISPAIGRYPQHDRDPLGRYLESLMVTAMLDPATVLPGHGAPFSGAAARARELVTHHADRIDACVDAVERLGRASAYEAALLAFAHVFSRRAATPADVRFATTETLAHLERARFDGRLDRVADDDGRIWFTPVEG